MHIFLFHRIDRRNIWIYCPPESKHTIPDNRPGSRQCCAIGPLFPSIQEISSDRHHFRCDSMMIMMMTTMMICWRYYYLWKMYCCDAWIWNWNEWMNASEWLAGHWTISNVMKLSILIVHSIILLTIACYWIDGLNHTSIWLCSVSHTHTHALSPTHTVSHTDIEWHFVIYNVAIWL